MEELMNKGITMTYTGVFSKKDQKVVHVSFERKTDTGTDCAEAVIPECSFIYVKGFTVEERQELERYLQKNADAIFKMARKINKELIYKL